MHVTKDTSYIIQVQYGYRHIHKNWDVRSIDGPVEGMLGSDPAVWKASLLTAQVTFSGDPRSFTSLRAPRLSPDTLMCLSL